MSKLHQIKSYFNFLKRSTNQHGVHSPFVYDLVTKCFYDKQKYLQYDTIKSYKKRLLNNTSTLHVTDLGAGSHVFKTNVRQVSKMAKVAGSSLKEARFLFRLSQYFKPNTILELGTSLGIATQALSLGNPNAQVTTIEGCPNVSAVAKANFNNFNLKNINLITGDFTKVIKAFPSNTFNLIYCDGNHNKAATLKYFETLLPHTDNETLFILDDMYWSKDMTDAWEAIKQHPKVTVTIDTYNFGLVFFRQEQAKQHFTIRL